MIRLMRVAILSLVLVLPTAALSQSTVTPLELMRAADRHAKAHHARYTPVLSPMDGPSSPVTAADIARVRAAGFPVIVWTVDDAARQQQLFDSGIDGIISDRPDLLRSLVERNRSARGGILNARGLLNRNKFDAQGHRGARDLRPESTFPAFEAALDNLVTTLETDVAITSDGVAVLSHERHINLQTCRALIGAPASRDIFFRNITAAELRRTYVCDQLIRGPSQSNDLSLSPVSTAFAAQRKLPSAFVHPTLQELFDFVRFYQVFYSRGDGRNQADAARRSANAARVRFNLETKLDPRFPDQTVTPSRFVDVLAGTIVRNRMQARCDIQSFDFRTLVYAQAHYPAMRTVYLIDNRQQLLVENLPAEYMDRQ
jgi:glycerophosphoryl diester phosphodiesterase